MRRFRNGLYSGLEVAWWIGVVRHATTLTVCNRMTSNREAIRRLFAVELDLTDNQPPLPAIFPD